MTPEPNSLERSVPCAECGAIMLWTQDAWRRGESRSAAYRCVKGHVLDPGTTRQCPHCGEHDTTRMTGDDVETAACVCNRCGQRFEVTG